MYLPHRLRSLKLLLSFAICALLHANGAAAEGFSFADSMNYVHLGGTTTLMQDGRMLVAGGSNGNIAEIFDPANPLHNWTQTPGTMSTPREFAVAAPLPNGLVLIAGGRTGTGSNPTLSSAELFDPATGFFNPTGGMHNRRLWATATRLANGKVLIAGGYDAGDGSGPDGDPAQGYLNTAELYDPVTGVFTSCAGTMSTTRGWGSAALMANGKALIVGGENGFGVSTAADIYDPATDTFSATPAMSVARERASVTLLRNRKVLIAGGSSSASAVLYDPSLNYFTATAGAPAVVRDGGSAAMLPNGKVLIFGGASGKYTAALSAELYDPEVNSFSTLANFFESHQFGVAAMLPSGKVLLASGETPPVNGNYGPTLNQITETYDPSTPVVATAASLKAARTQASSTLLANGQVLVVGGANSAPLATAETYNLATNTFTTTAAPMASARNSPSAVLLPNGKVLVAEGTSGASASPVRQTELYDPAARIFAATSGTPYHAHAGGSVVQLLDGNVLMAGGRESSFPIGNAEIYHWLSGSFQPVGAMATPRAGASTVTLANGQVLVMGGQDAGGNVLNTAEIYDPSTMQFSATGSLNTARISAAAVLLPNGQVLVAGGMTTTVNTSATNTAEIYDPVAGTFYQYATVSSMTTARYSAGAILLPTGQALIVGGLGSGGVALNSTELFDATRTNVLSYQPFAAGPNLVTARSSTSLALLADGSVLVAGGSNSTGALASAENLHMDVDAAIDHHIRPQLNAILPIQMPSPNSGVQPASIDLQGAGFIGTMQFSQGGIVGGSEGSGGGTTTNAPSNFPLVQFHRIDNQQQFFLQPNLDPLAGDTAWSDISFPMSAFLPFDEFDPTNPQGLPAGQYRVSIFVNGIPSAPRIFSAYWIEDYIYANDFESH